MPEGSAQELSELARELAEAGSRITPLLVELFPPDRDDHLSVPFWHHMGTGGKRIRPALCLLCCEALGADPDRALPFAAAVEILHNMLLIHDDMEDGDTVRRDAPTVWVKFGLENAINLGDYMLGRAYGAILRSPVDTGTRLRLAAAFTEAYECTCRGQALDLSSRGLDELTLEQYEQMAALKTGQCLVLGIVGGAILAGLDESAVKAILELGSSVGPAFQIRDDMIDLTLSKGRGGTRGSDIREGKPSVLYVHALSAASGSERRRLVEIARKSRPETTDEEVEWVMGLYGRLGSLEFARARAQELAADALRSADLIPVANRDFFRRVVRFMIERTS